MTIRMHAIAVVAAVIVTVIPAALPMRAGLIDAGSKPDSSRYITPRNGNDEVLSRSLAATSTDVASTVDYQAPDDFTLPLQLLPANDCWMELMRHRQAAEQILQYPRWFNLRLSYNSLAVRIAGSQHGRTLINMLFPGKPKPDSHISIVNLPIDIQPATESLRIKLFALDPLLITLDIRSS